MARSKINISNINWGSTPSGSAAGAASFLAINSSGRLVMAEGGGGVANVDVISGSSATYHTISGSTGTFNSVDIDRIVTNQISGSTATINTVSGTVGVFHNFSGSTGKFNYLEANRISTISLTGSGGMMIGNANTDDLSIMAGLITDLVPQNDEKVSLGSAAKQYTAIYAASGSFGDNVGVGGTISGSAVTTHTATVDKVVAKQITSTSFTGSGGMMIGNANSDDLSIMAGLITDLVPQNDSKVDLGTSSKQFAEAHIDTGYIDVITASYAKITSLDVDVIASRTVTKESLEIKDNLIIAGVSGSKAGNFIGAGFQIGGTVGIEGTGSNPLMSLTLGSRTLTGDSLIINVDGQAGASFKSGSVTQAALGYAGMRFGVTGSISGSLIQAKKAEIGVMNIQHMSSSKVSAQTLHVYGEISGSGTNALIKKSHLHRNVVQNNTDAHGGLVFIGGRLSVGCRKMIFVRSDGSNISGSTPTKGMFASHAMPTPYTTASLSAQPQSGSLMVYLNGVLLHGDHPGQNPHGSTSADYRVVTASNAYKVLMHQDLALDADDILTVTFLSGSGVSS